MRMRSLPIVAIVLALSGGSAKADTPQEKKRLLCAQCLDYPITVFAIGTFFQGKTDDGLFRRVSGGIGATLAVREWLVPYSIIYGGRTWFDYDKTAGMTDKAGGMKATGTSNVRFRLFTPADISIEVGISGRPFKWRWFELWVYSGYESSLYRLDRLNVESAVFSASGGLLDGTKQDVTKNAQDNTTMYYSWHRVRVGMRLLFDFRWVSPYVEVGFERLDAAIDIGLNQKTRDFISGLGYDASKIEGHFPIVYNAAIIVPGLVIKMHRRVWMRMQGIAIPYVGNWFGGVQWVPAEVRF